MDLKLNDHKIVLEGMNSPRNAFNNEGNPLTEEERKLNHED